MSDLILYFGVFEFILFIVILVSITSLIGLIFFNKKSKERIQLLLSSLPFPAMFFRGEKLVLHNGSGEEWQENLDIKTLIQDSHTARESIVRTIPAVEGQSFQARAIHLGGKQTLLLLEDMGAAQRQQAFYRNFIQNVSHELKTPLTVIQGHAAKVLNMPEDREGWTASLRIITEETKRLTQLVDNLLTLSRLESPSFILEVSKMSMGALLEDAILQLSDVAEERNLSLDLHLEPGLPHVRADRARLKQVVLNLLDNAIKYTSPGGSIRVRLEQDSENERLLCYVEDTGEGIPTEDLPHIFDKLYRVRRVHGVPVEGSGLGLTLAREIILAHGGNISVESEVGVGSTFRISIPLEPVPTQETS
jgi:two-component system phosphate regulon sensor histidine kinase PhoR